MNAKAVMVVLSEKFRDNEITIVDKITFKENKTKAFAEALKNLKIKGSILDKNELGTILN